MKRDMDLIRRIVLAIRDHESKPMLSEVYVIAESVDLGGRALPEVDFDDLPYPPEHFVYHMELLIESQLIDGRDIGTLDQPDAISDICLTWAGQDFADDIASDTVWGNVKKAMKDNDVKSASFSIWAQVIAQQVAMNLGIA